MVMFPYVTIRFWLTAGTKPCGVWAETSWRSVAASVKVESCILGSEGSASSKTSVEQSVSFSKWVKRMEGLIYVRDIAVQRMT
jgi:hypothetical protein